MSFTIEMSISPASMDFEPSPKPLDYLPSTSCYGVCGEFIIMPQEALTEDLEVGVGKIYLVRLVKN